jgi:hypothetical protein
MTSLTLFRTFFPRLGAIRAVTVVPPTAASPPAPLPNAQFELCAVPKKKVCEGVCLFVCCWLVGWLVGWFVGLCVHVHVCVCVCVCVCLHTIYWVLLHVSGYSLPAGSVNCERLDLCIWRSSIAYAAVPLQEELAFHYCVACWLVFTIFW